MPSAAAAARCGMIELPRFYEACRRKSGGETGEGVSPVLRAGGLAGVRGGNT